MNMFFANRKKLILIIIAVLLLIAAVIATVVIVSDKPDRDVNTPFENAEVNAVDKVEADLGEGLKVVTVGNYTGVFFEDGTDEIVTDILMIELYNSSDKDLQLARIKLKYPDFSAEFEATNIPSGMSAVLLSKSRSPYTSEKYQSISADNVVFFDSSMNKMEELLKVDGGDGYVEVQNISDETIDGTTYVYYKNVADDKLYGGITYRAKISEAIPAGESVKILTGHFTEKNTMVVQVLNAK